MDDVLEAKFEQIMTDAVVRAERLNPDMSHTDFYEGLMAMQIVLHKRLEEARVDAGVEPPDHRNFTF